MAIEPISKYGSHNGQPETLEEYRLRRRNARKNAVVSVKRELRVRDGIGCRWPGCEFWKQGFRVEGVHLEDMGMGGDKALDRSQRHKMIRLCIKHHQGPFSIHSKHREVVPLTSRGTDGPCEFRTRKTLDDRWIQDGIENEWDFRNRRNEAAAEDSESDE